MAGPSSSPGLLDGRTQPTNPNPQPNESRTPMISHRKLITALAEIVPTLPQPNTPAYRAEVRAARAVFAACSMKNGGGQKPTLLTRQDASAKLAHNANGQHELEQSVMYLQPHTLSRLVSICPFSTPQCRATCLESSGRLGMDSGEIAKQTRTELLATDPRAFLICLMHEVKLHADRIHKCGKKFVLRLNGTADIQWQTVAGLRRLLTIAGVDHFQDYTKKRDGRSLPATPNLAPWHITRSATERTKPEQLTPGMAVLVDVKPKQPMPDRIPGCSLPVIDGDRLHGDLRILDKGANPRAVVALRAKGKARKLTPGPASFVKSIAAG